MDVKGASNVLGLDQGTIRKLIKKGLLFAEKKKNLIQFTKIVVTTMERDVWDITEESVKAFQESDYNKTKRFAF